MRLPEATFFKEENMIRRQDFGVLLFYYLGFSRIRNLILRLSRKPVARFLAFHDILPEAFAQFRANIIYLQQHTNVISIDDYHRGHMLSDKLNVVITFDDGYKSWITRAVPVLKELGLPAIFFVSSGFVGLRHEEEIEFVRLNLCQTQDNQRISGSLTSAEVKMIADEGFAVGGHTLNHRNLGKLGDRAQLQYEIAEDKKRLEEITGRNVEYFAYPSGGAFNRLTNLARLLTESGYRGAVTTAPGFNSENSDPYLLHRELTGATMPSSVFKARVLGNYDPIRFVRELLASLPKLE